MIRKTWNLRKTASQQTTTQSIPETKQKEDTNQMPNWMGPTHTECLWPKQDPDNTFKKFQSP